MNRCVIFSLLTDNTAVIAFSHTYFLNSKYVPGMASVNYQYPITMSDDSDVEDNEAELQVVASNQSKDRLNVELSSRIQTCTLLTSYLEDFSTTDVSTNPKAVDQMIRKSGVQNIEKADSVQPFEISKRKKKLDRKKEKEKTKGPEWYNLPATELTEDKKNDLEIIQMRSVLDPKRFYKKNDLKTLPKYFQVGTVIDTPIDYYNDRVPRKQRKKTLVDELMADANFQKFNKKKFMEIQDRKQRQTGYHKHVKRMKKNK